MADADMTAPRPLPPEREPMSGCGIFLLGAAAVLIAIFLIPFLGLILLFAKWYIGGIVLFFAIVIVAGLIFEDTRNE